MNKVLTRLSLVMVLMLLVSMLAACGGGGGDDNDNGDDDEPKVTATSNSGQDDASPTTSGALQPANSSSASRKARSITSPLQLPPKPRWPRTTQGCRSRVAWTSCRVYNGAKTERGQCPLLNARAGRTGA